MNEELRKIFNYGPNFREQTPPNKEKVISSISLGVDRYINSVAKATKTQTNSYSVWKKLVLKECKNKLAKLKPYNYNVILNKDNVKLCLEKLHQDFVLVPVDKASCNVAFVCKSYYMQVLSKEVTQPPTFSPSPNSSVEVIDSCKKFLNSHGIRSQEDSLPFLYWTAKMH